MIVAGIGFRSSASAADIVGLLRRAQEQSGQGIDLLAIPEFKQGCAALLEALPMLGVPHVCISRSELERVQARCPTRSAAARTAVGVGSVAEACALAPLDEDATLVLPRMASAQVTCALAAGNRT